MGRLAVGHVTPKSSPCESFLTIKHGGGGIMIWGSNEACVFMDLD